MEWNSLTNKFKGHPLITRTLRSGYQIEQSLFIPIQFPAARGCKGTSGWIQIQTASIGAESLLTLETKILTLKETIITVEAIIKKDSISENLQTDSVSLEHAVFENFQVSAEDLKKLQDEYNELIFKKHKVWSRSFVIPKTFVGLSFQVHNGSKFVLLKITEKIVGYRFGEFVPTRKVTIHKEAKKKK